MTDLVVVERELTARLPIFQQLLPPSVTPQRLMRTVLMSIEKTPKLLQCSPQSVINAATTAAVLGLEVDGVTGQGFLIPYAGVATFQIGYKGYNTMAARAGYTINGGVVREGDDFDFREGTRGFVHHKKSLENQYNRKIIAAWATGESNGRPSIVAVIPIDEILAIKEKSPGAKKADSPWNDPRVGFPAMVEKTAKRRLARSMPQSVMQLGAALEDRYDMGQPAYLTPDGDLKIVGEASTASLPSVGGPESGGTINTRQPDDLTSPANPPPAPRFPSFSKMVDFVTYSRRFLGGATVIQIEKWEEHYKEKLDGMKDSRIDEVRAAYASLIAERDLAIKRAGD